MQHLVPRFAAGALVLITGVAYADLGDQIAKLLPGDGESGDHFGLSVAISGTTAIVGAPLHDDNGKQSGSAFLFDTATGKQIAELLPSDGEAGDSLGCSVAISSTTAIVGASQDDDNGTNSGSVYLYDTTTGQEIAKLLASDGQSFDTFGYSVAISGTIAVIGAPQADDSGSKSGSAYLFDATTGQEIAELLANDAEAGDYFGSSVAISGTTVIVGALLDDDNGSRSGSAYLFDVTTGQQLAKLLPDDGAANDEFGGSVGISGTTAIVGAWGDDYNETGSGSAYLFDTITGQQIAKLLPSDGNMGDWFGISVGISGTAAIVGALLDDDNGFDSGSAYLFDTATGHQVAKFLPIDGEQGSLFGHSVAISATTAVVGASTDPGNGSLSGAAYLLVAATGIGTNYCGPANFNSTGQSAVISGFGNTITVHHELVLSATQLPTGRFGYFLNSDVQDFKPFTSGSQGNLCLGGDIGRHVKQMANSGSAGEFVIQVDLTALPRPDGTHAVVAGETWNFQCWFRDQNPGATSNFTDGISITFR